MQYTKYFATIVDTSGAPRLSVKAFKIYMNIVSLESRIDALDKAKRLPNINSDTVTFINSELYKKLTFLTQGKSPDEVFRNLYYLE